MAGKEELNRIVLAGDERALSDPALAGSILRRATALLASAEPEKKWRAVKAMGIVAGATEAGRVDEQVSRLLWSLNDESGAVPYGVPEALGEIAAARPELKPRIVPILVSCVVSADMSQTGPILAGALRALGRAGVADPAERERLLPGLKAALLCPDPEVAEAAEVTADLLGITAGERGKE